ncbi:hypothetical protein BGZ70_000536 [Mortierella alpina]|uniref:Uncharacterized protein n=1 Tax=Mortierella alpina TaxID=64518 RepID=A0A9P6IXU9_MORAP|nr:hypothetical protein BGZ70_000536 [Mortierella alpina]
MNTNTNKNNQASQKADRMAGNGQRARTGREDSTMQSEQNEAQPHQSPMRVAASRPDSHEFKVAGDVYGGSMRQKNQPSKSGSVTDDKGFVLPLADSAVAKEMVAGRKEQEPVNHLHQTLEHNVRVGINKPSLTVFSSMGGSRNGSSTKTESGGAGSKKASGNGSPKEFEYRDEDFQPLSAPGNSKQRVSPGISKAASSAGQNAARSSKSSATNKPATSLEESHRQQAGHHSQRDVSPELALGTLSQDGQQGGLRASSQHSGSLPVGKHAAPTRVLPVAPTQQKSKPSHGSYRAAAPAPAVAFPSTNLRKETPDRKQDHTPEMNLGSLFQEDEPFMNSHSSQHQQQHQTKAAPRFQRFGVSNGHQDVLEQPSSSGSAVVPPYHASYGPNRHVQQAVPIHKSAMPPVLGKSRDEPIAQTHVQGNAAHMQTEAAGLNAASYPSFVRHPAQSNQHPVSTSTTTKSGGKLNQGKREVHPAHPKRMSKRERKAARRSEAAKHMSVLDSISSALVGRRKNSVSSPVMRLNELFEPSEQWAPQTEEHLSSAAVAASLGGIRSMLGSIHMPALISRQPSDANAPMPSKAAALKVPRINLALYPEEQPDYSRGINIKRENPRPAKLSAHVRNITEIPYHGSSASGYNTRSTVASARVRGPPLAHMILDLHARHAGPFKEQSQSANASTTTRARNQQTRHSTAAALKKPKLNLSLFPEEEADYPRGEGLHRSNRPARHANLVEIKEIQLDSAHRHAHHDLHPTMAETATTAVTQGIAGLKSMWGSMHAPTSVSPEGGAVNNPAAAAVLSTMAAAAMHHVPSAPEVHRAPKQPLNSTLTPANNTHLNEAYEQQQRDSAVKSKKPAASNLPLMYGTSVHSSSSSHDHAPPIPTKHEQHHEPAAQYHSVAPKIVSVPNQGYSSHRPAGASAAVPIAAAVGSVHANSLRQQQQHQPHEPQRNHRFVASEHHARRMEIHPTAEDAEERFFPAQDWQSPAVRQTPMMSTHGAALKPKNDPALLLARRTAPMSVLPSASHSRKGIMIAGPAQHGQQHHQQQKLSGGINSASLPMAAAAGVGTAAASHGLHQHQQQTPTKVPVAKIPIAEPPVQVPVRPLRVPIAQPPATVSSTHREPGMNAEASAVRSPGSRVPGKHIRSRLSHDSSTSVGALAAAPLMAASAAAVKPDNVVLMESDNAHPLEHAGDHKHQHHHHQQEPISGALARDAHAHTHDAPAAESATRVAPVTGQHQSPQHHTGAAMAGAAMAGAAMAGAAVPILATAPRIAASAMNTVHTGQPAPGPGERVVMKKKTTTTTTVPVEDPFTTSGPAATVAPVRASEPIVIPTQHAGEDVVIQTRTVPKGSQEEHRPLQQQAVPKQRQQPVQKAHFKEATIIPTQHAGEDIIVQARTVPADAKSAARSSPHLQDSHKLSHHYGVQALGASAAATAAAAAARPIHHNSFDRSTVEGTRADMGSGTTGATHVPKSAHRDTPVISNVAAPTAQSIMASSASFDPAANANAGAVKPASIAVHTPASPRYRHAAVQKGVGTTVGAPSAAAIHSTHFPVPAPRPAGSHPTAAAVATAAAVPIVAASAVHKDNHGSNHVGAASVDRQSVDRQRYASTSVPAVPVMNQTYNRHSTTSGVTPVTTSIHSQSIQPMAAPIHVSAPVAAATASTVRPSGYEGPLPAVNAGEKVMWVKKVRTTQEYYDSDEEGGDELDMDEFGYRRDRDVSLHLPAKTGTHSQPVSRSGSVSGSVGSDEARQQQAVLQQHQETNADATRRGLAQ